ncbi:MAG: pilus assembly PilX N-terminal domain-containing protein [Deltaproteobacteria bacterium]|nr:pilus assembly PilX N-terminal domain-containing protein [Deltaproteobacteria bacterium]
MGGKIRRKLQQEDGAILAISLIMMALLSLIGTMAIMTSSMEAKISGNEKQYKIAFYAADSGMEQARWLLRNDHEESGSDYGWSDELSGNHDDYSQATDQNFAGAALRLDQSAATNPIRYKIWIWNNVGPLGSPETATTDSDNMIWVRVQGWGDPRPGASQEEAMVEIEAMLEGTAAPGPRRYIAQEGAGSAKHSSTDDIGNVDTSRSITM